LAGYLSWTRNAAICAGVGATIKIIEDSLPIGDDFVMGEWGDFVMGEWGGFVMGEWGDCDG